MTNRSLVSSLFILLSLNCTLSAASTFSFDDVKEGRFEPRELEHMSSSMEKHVRGKSFFDEKCGRLLSAPEVPNAISSTAPNGLISTMMLAYSRHVPLVLRPDDVWLGIASAFGTYVTTHAEEMRGVFVTHQGRKRLTVQAGGSLAGLDENGWAALAGEMANAIDENLTSRMKDWIVPGFSTTTPKDQLASRIVLMGAMQRYFQYTMVLACGLSKVTLEGSLEDWVDLRERAARLAEFGGDLERWSKELLLVLDEFIQAYRGDVNADFWQRIATHKFLGSGGEKSLRGWFLVFAPFNAKGEYHLNSREVIQETNVYGDVEDVSIVGAAMDVPVKINDNGIEHDAIFYGGVTMPQYDAGKNELRPAVGWAIVENGPKK